MQKKDTIKITIRPFKIEDAEAVQWFASDELVNRTTNMPYPYPKNGGLTFVKASMEGWLNKKNYNFAIQANDKVIGSISLSLPNYEKGTIRCDYAISSSYWGQGIATEAIKLALSYAFINLDVKVVISSCLDRNPASRRVLEKNGFTETGNFIFSNNKFKDESAHWFELTREKWKK